MSLGVLLGYVLSLVFLVSGVAYALKGGKGR